MKSISAANHSCKDKLGKVMFLSLRTEFLDFKTLSHLSGGKHQSTSMCSLWIKELYSTKWFKWVVGFVWVVGEENTLCSPSSLCVTQTLSLFQVTVLCCQKESMSGALRPFFTLCEEIWTLLERRAKLWTGAKNVSDVRTHSLTHKLVNACTLTHNKRPRVNVYRSHCAHGERKWTQWSGQLDVTDLPTITAGVGQDRDSQSCLTQTTAMSLHPPGSFTFIPPLSEVPDV